MNAEPNRLDIHVHVPSGTIIRVLLTILATWAVLRLWPEFIFLSLSLVLAVALHPLAARLENRGLSRGAAVMAIGAVMVAVAVLLLGVVFTALAEQAGRLAYVPRRHRDKMAVTVDEVTQVVTVYVRGQLIASALFTTFSAVMLSAFQVPAALPLTVQTSLRKEKDV